MYLDRVLGTGTKVSLIGVLIAGQSRKYTESELAREAHVAVSETNRQMKELVNSGLVRMERAGRSKMYSVNEGHFLVKPLRLLFQDLNRVYRQAAEKIAKFAVSSSREVEAVILLGSVAKGKAKQDIVGTPSDIDMVFVVKNPSSKEKLFDGLISYVNREIAPAYGVICYPIVVSKGEYLEGLGKNDRLILDAHAEGVELYGRKPQRFGKVGA